MTSSTKHIVFLHLGVAPYECPKLECCAYNAADFRAGDQNNWKPCKECIDSSRAYDEALHSDLDVPALLDMLRSEGVHPSVELRCDTFSV